MADTAASLKLTFDGAMKLLNAAIAKAREMRVPQCISIVDTGGDLLALGRQDGAVSQSIHTPLMKGMTAAPSGIPTPDIPPRSDPNTPLPTPGTRTNTPA